MIESDKRTAMYQMHQAGMSLRAISRQMNVSRATVAAVIRRQGKAPKIERKDRIQVDPDLLRRLYEECGGWKQRIHERLVEEHNLQISYPTLTRLLRNSGIGNARNVRCDQVPDEPGLEMQHDTSVYRVTLGGQRVKLIASLLYLRYSKRRYLRFYRVFNRFTMKCFLHEALMFWSYAPRQCVIDNTNLARWRGTGSRAVIVPEMVAFAKQYGFVFICHELLHCNPPGQPRPRSWPKNQKRSSEPEERRLRALGPEVAAYVDFAVRTPGLQRHRFVRELFALSRRVTSDVFVQTVERALRYRIVEVATLQRIAWNYVSQGGWSALDCDEVVIDEGFRDRPAYREGCLTDEPDFSRYESAVEEVDEQAFDEDDSEDPRDEDEFDEDEFEDSRDELTSPNLELDWARAEASLEGETLIPLDSLTPPTDDEEADDDDESEAQHG